MEEDAIDENVTDTCDENEEEVQETESLGDVAYGVFGIMLNRELKKTGGYLFERVESGEDFFTEFERIFAEFCLDYEMLGDAVKESFGTAEAVYEGILAGEGIVPSKTTRVYWIIQDAPDFKADGADEDKGGKWLVFVDKNESDEMWRKIRSATAAGELGISCKVSTAKSPSDDDNRVVIFVNTKDWSDEADVMRIREVLRGLGVEKRIGYKRNIETYQGEYAEGGRRVTYYSA